MIGLGKTLSVPSSISKSLIYSQSEKSPFDITFLNVSGPLATLKFLG